MTFAEINKRVKAIRELIKKVKFEDALSELESFIETIEDKELDKEIIALTARYNVEKKEERLGIKNDSRNKNEIINTIIEILSEAKERAIDKVTPKENEELEKINKVRSERVENLSPKLSVAFDNQQQSGKYKISQISQSKDDFVANEMLKISNEYPKMKLSAEIEKEKELFQKKLDSMPGDTIINRLRKEQELLEFRSGFKSFKDIVREEDKEKYNSELLVFFSDYEQHLNKLFDYKVQKKLTIEIVLLLINNGTCPAEDIDIYFHFPDGFELYNEESYPKEPLSPNTPKKPRAMFDVRYPVPPNIFGADYSNNIVHHSTTESNISIKKTNSYDVETHVGKLKHNKSIALHEMYLIFDKHESIIDFCVDYELRCANIPKIVRGKLDFVIEKPNN